MSERRTVVVADAKEVARVLAARSDYECLQVSAGGAELAAAP